jgi:hypothetical protein
MSLKTKILINRQYPNALKGHRIDLNQVCGVLGLYKVDIDQVCTELIETAVILLTNTLTPTLSQRERGLNSSLSPLGRGLG